MYNSAQHITADNLDHFLQMFMLETNADPGVQKAFDIQLEFVFSENEIQKKLSPAEKEIIKRIAKSKGYVSSKGFNRSFFTWTLSLLISFMILFFVWKFFGMAENRHAASQAYRHVPETSFSNNIIPQEKEPVIKEKTAVVKSDKDSLIQSNARSIKREKPFSQNIYFPRDEDFRLKRNSSDKNDNFMNLDFESTYPDSKTPEIWWTMNDIWYKTDYKTSLDSTVSFSGNHSLKIEYSQQKEAKFHFVNFTNYIPEELLKGKSNVEISAAIKVSDDEWKKVYVFCSLYGKKNDAFTKVKRATVTSSGQEGAQIGDWKYFTLELLLDSAYTGIQFGGFYYGEKEVWFDAFDVTIDGEKIKDLKPIYKAPKEKEISWLDENCINIKTLNAETNNDDFSELKNIIGNATIVAMDNKENSSSETFKIQQRMIKFLVEENNFNIIALFTGMPETEPINQYIQTGNGDLKQMLDSIHYWSWDTKEMADIIEWLKNYNQSGKGKILFYGFDYTNKNYAIEILKNFGLKYDTKFIDLLDKLEKVTLKMDDKKNRNAPEYFKNKLDQWSAVIEKMNKELKTNESSLKQKISIAEFNWIKQNITVLEQYYNQTYSYPYSGSERCAHLKNNIYWIMKQNPGSKMILLTFGGIMKKQKDYWLGYQLEKDYGDSLYSMVFASDSGEYIAYNDSVLSTNKLVPPFKGTYEYYFEKCKYPNFILDLHKATISDSASKWLAEKLYFRNIFGMTTIRQFDFIELQKNYDAVINIRNATASDCYKLGLKKRYK